MKCIGSICPHCEIRRALDGEWFELCKYSDEVIVDDYEYPKVEDETNG